MFIPLINQDDRGDPSFGVSMLTDKIPISNDIEYRRRLILLHDDIDTNRSMIEGVHTTKGTVSNMSVLDGGKCYEGYAIPDKVLCKTVYHGYFVNELDLLDNGNVGFNENLVNKAKFNITNAYTIMHGVWMDIDGTIKYVSYYGISMLDMYSLRQRVMSVDMVPMVIDSTFSLSYKISYNQDDWHSVLPIPNPVFYSAYHAEYNRDYPILMDPYPISGSSLLDSTTQVLKVKTNRVKSDETNYRLEHDSFNNISYIDNSGKEIVQGDNRYTRIAVQMIGVSSLISNLVEKVFTPFNRYMMNRCVIVYDSYRDKVVIRDLLYGFSEVPSGLYENFILDIKEDIEILEAFRDFYISYDHVTVILMMTDVRCQVRVGFHSEVKGCKDLKRVVYNKSILDLISEGTEISQSVLEPITQIINY